MTKITTSKLINEINAQQDSGCPFPTAVRKIYLDKLESNIKKLVSMQASRETLL
ncbi:hypothetical protein GF357_04025 [Candidatus Dojkabacteria bacterium]|nr:hypothetical protein [Candidatus Dojkabacteria bacterium]